MFHASVEFNLCAFLFFGALVEGNLRWLHFRLNFFDQFVVDNALVCPRTFRVMVMVVLRFQVLHS